MIEAMYASKIDHLIALEEGLYEAKDQFDVARKTPAFQRAFELSNPLVTICVATFNRRALLIERALPSLLQQTYTNIEIVIVGDCCTDDTAQRVAQLRDSRIVFENLQERGPYPRPGIRRWLVAGTYAMNRALELATGDFVTHLDDDDQVTLTRIERLVEIAQSERLEFLWHAFQYQNHDRTWKTLGHDTLRHGQVTTGSIFYHKYFSRIPWDVYAFRQQEPGDWNRVRKIKFLDPNRRYVDETHLFHYVERNQRPSTSMEHERFLEY